ncbi:MAG: AbrB/MazE/SpoVT family DNA-binding domain-containing protein [Oscillospiraceae bacterium]|nr:AbrB/MazE/SpoVT family DNA-binding domain-containing protein [Oscillospiraceae bacterium]
METTLQLASWGGSTALRIPKNFLQQMNMTDNSTVKIKISDNNELIISPVYQHKTLEERFKNWDGDYKLTDEDKEWLNMESAGAEI